MFIDLIAVLLVLYGFYIGYTRGIIKTVFAVISIIIGIVAALKLSPISIEFLEKITDFHPGFTFVIGFALTFIVVLVLIRFIGKKTEDFLKFAQINFINKLLGGVIMASLMLIMYSYAIWGIDSLQLFSDKSKETSTTYEYLTTVTAKTESTLQNLRPYFDEFWDKIIETFDSIKNYEEELKKSK